MMPAILDTALVILAVAAAIGYLVWRRVRRLRRRARDWSSGHPETCDGCGVMEIHKAQLKAAQKAPDNS